MSFLCLRLKTIIYQYHSNCISFFILSDFDILFSFLNREFKELFKKWISFVLLILKNNHKLLTYLDIIIVEYQK